MLLADRLQLLAVRVVGERLDDVGTRVDEFAVELGDELGVLEDDLGNEGASLQVAPPLELEQIALGADDGTLLEPLEKAHLRACSAHTQPYPRRRGRRGRPHRAQVAADRGAGRGTTRGSASARRGVR